MSTAQHTADGDPPVVRFTCTGCGWDFWVAVERPSLLGDPPLCRACATGRPVREKAAFVERKVRGESAP